MLSVLTSTIHTEAAVLLLSSELFLVQRRYSIFRNGLFEFKVQKLDHKVFAILIGSFAISRKFIWKAFTLDATMTATS